MQVRIHSTGAAPGHAMPGHPERPARIDAALAGVRASGADLAWPIVVAAERMQIARIHTNTHIDRVRHAAGAWLDGDTYTTDASWQAALEAVGAAVGAARDAAANQPAFAVARPPGHHAEAGRPMGFCLFNNIAIAANELAAAGQRVSIVDIDVHHGNGTQDIFWTRGDVHYTSLHQFPFYPGTGDNHERGAGDGAGATCNVPLPAGTTDAQWRRAWTKRALPAVRAFAPDVILVSAGFDAHRRDPLASLSLKAVTFGDAVSDLLATTPRLACILEGGYDEQALRRSAAAVTRALARLPRRDDEDN